MSRNYKLQRRYTELGDYLREKREATGLTQREISEKLGYSSPQFISNFEAGISMPPLKKLRILIKEYRMIPGKVTRLALAGEEKKMMEILYG